MKENAYRFGHHEAHIEDVHSKVDDHGLLIIHKPAPRLGHAHGPNYSRLNLHVSDYWTLEEALRVLQTRSMQDLKFALEVKHALLSALVSAKVVKSYEDPKLMSMSVKEAAQRLADADLDPLSSDDLLIRRALQLTRQIAHGNHAAAQMLVAHHRVLHALEHQLGERQPNIAHQEFEYEMASLDATTQSSAGSIEIAGECSIECSI